MTRMVPSYILGAIARERREERNRTVHETTFEAGDRLKIVEECRQSDVCLYVRIKRNNQTIYSIRSYHPDDFAEVRRVFINLLRRLIETVSDLKTQERAIRELADMCCGKETA